ncbi:MAG: glycosyltransferase family 4 protein [Reichenbachiella sp.]|uniref:glycosyltransferase family 4 protein n=1 Tax=Reichenbachiella sp. TaxID=2184521 RepID=UPI003296843F
MKVLYIHQYFKRPEDGGSLRSYHLARELVKSGVDVTMITAHNHSSRRRKIVAGIDVIYLPVKYGNEMNFGKRSRAFIRFMLLAILESTRHRQIDFCYVMTTPLSTGAIALFNKIILRRPYIFEVGDLWPKVPIEMGLIKAKWKQKLLAWFENRFYRNAKGLVGLSEPISNHLHSIAPRIPFQTVFNISDCGGFVPSDKKQVWIEKYQVQNQFVVSYTGTFGLANDLIQLVDFAKEVEGLPIKFMMVGNGAEKEKIRKKVDEIGLQDVQIFDAMDKTQLLEVINVSDAMMVSFAAYDSLHTGSPNKFFDALAAGKLVVANFRGWLGDLIESENCGIVAQSPEEYKQKIKTFIDDDKKLTTFQVNARKLAEHKFELKIQSKIQQDFIAQLFN